MTLKFEQRRSTKILIRRAVEQDVVAQEPTPEPGQPDPIEVVTPSDGDGTETPP